MLRLLASMGEFAKLVREANLGLEEATIQMSPKKNILQRDPQFTPSVVQKWFTTLVSMENFGVVVTFQDVAAHAKLDHEQINIRFLP